MDKLSVYKIGGNVIDSKLDLHLFLEAFAQVQGPKILVHGGGKKASELLIKLGIEPTMVEGRRITDALTLEVVTMVFGGLNKQITASLQGLKCNAIGLSGADLNIIPAEKRIQGKTDFGWVGDPISGKHIETHTGIANLVHLLESDITPVFCALTHDRKGNLLNTNADTVASTIAGKLSVFFDIELIYCFEKDGVLMDNKMVIPKLSRVEFELLKEKGIIHSGMLPKIANAFEAIDSGVKQVKIKNSQNILNNIETVIA